MIPVLSLIHILILSVAVLTIYCIVLSLDIFSDTKYYTGYITINGIAGILILGILIYTFAFEKKNIFKFLKGNLKRILINKKRRKNKD